jgi:hypothetical protein
MRGRALQRFAFSMRFLRDLEGQQGSFHGVDGVVEDRFPRRCMSASSCTGCDSWAFVAPPPRPSPSPAGPRGLPVGPPSVPKNDRVPPIPSPHLRSARIEPGCSLAAAASPGLRPRSVPLFRPARDRPLPPHDTRPRGFGRWLPHHRVTFRPRGFAPPRRVPPVFGVRACCIPVPDVRFVAFRPPPTARLADRTGDVPDDAVHTLRRLSLASSRTASLRPLPSCRSPGTCAVRCTPFDDLGAVAACIVVMMVQDRFGTPAACRAGRTAARIASSCAAGALRAGPTEAGLAPASFGHRTPKSLRRSRCGCFSKDRSLRPHRGLPRDGHRLEPGLVASIARAMAGWIRDDAPRHGANPTPGLVSSRVGVSHAGSHQVLHPTPPSLPPKRKLPTVEPEGSTTLGDSIHPRGRPADSEEPARPHLAGVSTSVASPLLPSEDGVGGQLDFKALLRRRVRSDPSHC